MSPELPSPVRSALVTAGYRGGWWAVRRMPERTARALFAGLAGDVSRRRGRAVRQLEANLARVVPDAGPEQLRELTLASLRSYFRYWCEAFRLPVTDPARAAGLVDAPDAERILAPIRAGRGVIVALPHMANWDLAGVWAVQQGMPVSTVAERIRPEALFERFCAYRRGLGIDVLPLRGADGGPPAVDPTVVLAERLRAGGLACLVADRDISARGQPVRLLDAPALMPAGPAVLAVRTSAALVPATLWYSGERMHIDLHPEVLAQPPGARLREAVASMTQQVADVFTVGIRAHPADWHMMQRVFVDSSGPATAGPATPPSEESGPAGPFEVPAPDAAPYGARAAGPRPGTA